MEKLIVTQNPGEIDVSSQLFANYPDVVDVVQLCEMLGNISTKTGYRLLKTGQIRYILVGREYRMLKINVIKFLMSEK